MPLICGGYSHYCDCELWYSLSIDSLFIWYIMLIQKCVKKLCIFLDMTQQPMFTEVHYIKSTTSLMLISTVIDMMYHDIYANTNPYWSAVVR